MVGGWNEGEEEEPLQPFEGYRSSFTTMTP
jgi:hypothetical protein